MRVIDAHPGAGGGQRGAVGGVGGALTAGEVARIFKGLAARAGLGAASVSGHSCRVGMAQDLAGFGAELTELMVADRWRSSTMPARYAERATAGRGAVAQYYTRHGVR